MSGLQTVLANLNIAFTRENIGQIAAKREAFAPGKPLAAGVVIKEGTRLHALWVEYLAKIPASFQEAFRSVVRPDVRCADAQISRRPAAAKSAGLDLAQNSQALSRFRTFEPGLDLNRA